MPYLESYLLFISSQCRDLSMSVMFIFLECQCLIIIIYIALFKGNGSDNFFE